MDGYYGKKCKCLNSVTSNLFEPFFQLPAQVALFLHCPIPPKCKSLHSMYKNFRKYCFYLFYFPTTETLPLKASTLQLTVCLKYSLINHNHLVNILLTKMNLLCPYLGCHPCFL